jgi:hypothetical protein
MPFHLFLLEFLGRTLYILMYSRLPIIPCFTAWSIQMTAQIDKKVLEELRLLCQKIATTKEGNEVWQMENMRREEAFQGVNRDLRNLKISTALVQLDLVADNEVTDTVSSLAINNDTRGLRHLILDQVSDLEQSLSIINRTDPNIEYIENSIKTISVLIELLDAIECSM